MGAPIDIERAVQAFATSTDGTVGIEEELAVLDAETLDLAPRFEELRDAGAADDVLVDSIAGELISSEIEIRSGAGTDVDDARTRQADARRRLFSLAREHGIDEDELGELVRAGLLRATDDAERADVLEPRLADLLRGLVRRVSLDRLLDLLELLPGG